MVSKIRCNFLVIQCEERSLSNGQVNCTNNSFYESICSYTCDKGYILTGDLVAKCVLTGDEIVNWNNEIPACTSEYKFRIKYYCLVKTAWFKLFKL